jgi:hypothetical protein
VAQALGENVDDFRSDGGVSMEGIAKSLAIEPQHTYPLRSRA